MMLNRRDIIVGAPTLVASTVIFNNSCYAGGLGGFFKKVATTAVQGLNFVTNPAAQVAAAAKVLAPIISQISPDAARAAEMIGKVADQSSTIEGRLKIAVGVLAPAALPIFANVGSQLEQIDQYAQQAGAPLQLSSSIEQELRGDPGKYVNDNSDRLLDHISRTDAIELVASSLTIQPGGVVTPSISSKATGTPGFYPTVLQIADVLRLVSIFRGH